MPTRSLNPLALVLVVLFGTIAAGSLLPVHPFDPAWQWRVTTMFLNSAPLPLLALALLQIGSVLDPKDHKLQERRRLFARLAVAATIGFLLLIPLGVSAGLRQHSLEDGAKASRITMAEQRLAALRLAVREARSGDDLGERLRQLQGPLLAPSDQSTSLPLLKAQVGAVLDQAQIQIARQRAALPAAPTAALLPELLRNSVASLALAVGFAAFARRPGLEVTLLEELQAALRRGGDLRTRGRRITNQDYLRRLSDRED